jgi:hypothetical protein
LKERLRCNKPTGLQRQLLVVGLVLLLALLLFPKPLPAASPDYQLVRLHFKSQSQLQTWVDGGLDVWEVDGQTALVSLGKSQLLTLKTQGVDLEYVPTATRASFPACYRTYNDMLTFFQERETRYPDLFRLYDVGDSWEKENALADRDLYVARLTSPRGPTEKPKLFLVAEHHAREIITPEVAMDFIDDLLENYDQDPTITWLLDQREVWVMPMANPDGHARAAQMEDWRKNTNQAQRCSGGSPPWSYGVDLNRNYGYEWGLDVGSSPEPCNLTYRGEAPFSEPETRAIRDLVRDEHFNILVSLHSYGKLVLYPWAHTWHPAPDAENLSALATRMAGPGGYTAQQATGIGYVSSGDTTDWSYGELGIPSFTIEVGGGSFWPSCDVKGQLYQELRPALMYAAMAADHPYRVAGGPDVRQVAVEVGESQIDVRVRASDQWTGEDFIESAELFVGGLGAPGTGISLVPSDGECNSENEWLAGHLDESIFMPYVGRRVPLFVVAQDVTGKRGVPAVTWLDLRDYVVPRSQDVKLWAVGARDPTFEIKGGYVYQGPADEGHVLMTVYDNRVYRGGGTLGEVLYTLHDDQVQAGEGGPVIYTVKDHAVYQGRSDGGVLLYRIENNRLLEARGSWNLVTLTADVNLNDIQSEAATLLLPVLADRRY